MVDIYVLNSYLDKIAVIDTCRSVIWAERYREVGDCELYLPASAEAISVLQKGYYLLREDSAMVCQIKRVQISTDAEEGDYITVTGYDVKRWLDQRILWGTLSSHGKAEWYARVMVNRSLAVPTDSDRQLVDPDGRRILYVQTNSALTDALMEQASYFNVGEKVRELCLKFGWGYKITFVPASKLFFFSVYKGADRSGEVIFSDQYENLSSTQYATDDTNIENVALIAGEGEGSRRLTRTAGTATGMDRCEIFTDARDLSKSITYEELLATYPLSGSGGNGYIRQDGSTYWYTMSTLDIQIMDDAQLEQLQTDHPGGTVITEDGTRYYELTDVDIALLPSGAPATTDTVTLQDIIYGSYLINRGYQDLAEYGAITEFEGSISPDRNFVYGSDYTLGDIVKVRTNYGVEASVRILEAITVDDESGHSVQTIFETEV